MRNLIRQTFMVAILAAAVLSRFTSSAAADTLRVGKADPAAFSFVPLEVGMQTGIFKKYGINADITLLRKGGGAAAVAAVAGNAADMIGASDARAANLSQSRLFTVLFSPISPTRLATQMYGMASVTANDRGRDCG